MYKKSIKENSKFLVPFIEGIKYYGSDEIEQAIGTMIILNDHGDVLTCKHVAERFINNDITSPISANFSHYYDSTPYSYENNTEDEDTFFDGKKRKKITQKIKVNKDM